MGLIDEIIEWSEKEDPKDVDRWLEFARRILEVWKWNKQAIDDFLMWGEYGFNNNLLHYEKSTEDFYAEVNYCSDRMSIDRIFRCHCDYRNLKKEAQDETN